MQLVLVVFFPEAIAHLLICTQANKHSILELALFGGSCMFVVVVIVCGDSAVQGRFVPGKQARILPEERSSR